MIMRDSGRILRALQTEPGELFSLHNADNIVPPPGAVQGGEAVTIEFAVAGLGVKDINHLQHRRHSGGAVVRQSVAGPLRRGRVNYWSVGVDTRWAARLGLAAAFRNFDSTGDLIAALHEELHADPIPVYLSIDKDVLAADVVRTNWDQGLLREAALLETIDLLHGRLVGSDITGEISSYRYRSRFKRWLSRADGQMPIAPITLVEWQTQQRALNARLLARLAQAG